MDLFVVFVVFVFMVLFQVNADFRAMAEESQINLVLVSAYMWH